MTETMNDFIATLIRYARPHRRQLLIGTSFLMIEAAFGLLLPYMGGRFVDTLFSGVTSAWTITDILLLLALLFTTQAALAIAGGYLATRRAIAISADIRHKTFEHIQKLPLSYLQQRDQGHVLSVLTNDVPLLSHYLSASVISIPPAVVTGIGSIVLMALIDPWMALAAAAAVPLFYILIKLVGRGLRPITIALQEAHARLFAFEEERIALLPAIKAFNREGIERRGHDERMQKVVALSLHQDWREMAIGPGMMWAASMGMLLVLWLVSERLIGGEMNKGTIVTFLLYSALLTRPISGMAGLYGQTQHARAAVDRINELMAVTGEDYGEGKPDLRPVAGAIEFQDIGFAYPGRPPLYQGFNFSIAPRTVVAITGENGVGKSTLISLLLRFNVPSTGRILIDGQDTAVCRLSSVRQSIGYVSQQVYILNGTIRDNVAFGRPGATLAELERAARLAQALDFIEKLPQGWDTVVGDNGIRLSGGQKQRLALARVLLLDPAILVLDEATAMYDPDAEAHFIADCRDILHDRTVLLITHRPASLQLADRIVRLVNVEEGGRSRPGLLELSPGKPTQPMPME